MTGGVDAENKAVPVVRRARGRGRAFLRVAAAGFAINSISRAPADYPGGQAGSALLVEFKLAGQAYQALNGGPQFPFTEAISLSVSCADQAEVDRLWGALIADGGKPVQCGWLKDKYGLSWQIVPEALQRMMREGGPAQSARVFRAMRKMVKLDVATLQAAYEG